MSEAPAELWMRERPAPGHGWYQTALAPLKGSGAVRYVRADLYEALEARVDVMWRCWGKAPCLEPLPWRP